MQTLTKQNKLSIFDQARLELLSLFLPNKRIEGLLHNVVDGLEFSRLAQSQASWQKLYEEFEPETFQMIVKTLDELLQSRGVSIELAMMPGNGAKAPSVPCLSITVSSLRRAILLPLFDQISVRVCKMSAPFLGSNFWMEPDFNENPDLAFRRIVGMLNLELVCPPPLTQAA